MVKFICLLGYDVFTRREPRNFMKILILTVLLLIINIFGIFYISYVLIQKIFFQKLVSFLIEWLTLTDMVLCMIYLFISKRKGLSRI